MDRPSRYLAGMRAQEALAITGGDGWQDFHLVFPLAPPTCRIQIAAGMSGIAAGMSGIAAGISGR